METLDYWWGTQLPKNNLFFISGGLTASTLALGSEVRGGRGVDRRLIDAMSLQVAIRNNWTPCGSKFLGSQSRNRLHLI